MSLIEAIEKDLNEFGFKSEEELRIYLRYLISQAYMGASGDTNTHKYIKDQIINEKDYKKELKNLVFMGENILNLEQLFNEITESVLSDYMKKNNVASLDDAVLKMLDYYENSFDKNNIDNTIFVSKQILNNYFVKGLINAFSSKNGTRDYIRNTSKSDLINQMKAKTNLSSSLNDNMNLDVLINSYANFIGTQYYNNQRRYDLDELSNEKSSTNGSDELSNIIESIENEIEKASINDRLKEHLKEELQKGNVDMLDRFVNPNLLREYERLSNSDKHYKI